MVSDDCIREGLAGALLQGGDGIAIGFARFQLASRLEQGGVSPGTVGKV